MIGEWLQVLHESSFETKIFHPDFSLVSLAGLNVCIGLCISGFLVIRWCFPMISPSRHLLRGASHTGHTLHSCLSLLIWLAMVIEGRVVVHERSTVLAMGINVFLLVWNRALLTTCETVLQRRLMELAYRKAMDDAVVLYSVSEAHCKEVITEAHVLRSFLTLIHNELNHRGIHTATERATNGKKAFDSLVARERLHRSMIDSPHIQENLSNWRKFMVLGDEEEDVDGESMEKVD